MDRDAVERAVRDGDGVVHLVVRAKPRSKAEGLAVGNDGSLIVRVRAPPVDGAANVRVLEVVAEALALPKSAVRLARGDSARLKQLEIRGIARADLVARLAGADPS